MPGASLVDPGLTTWTDNVDNWRAADADYLQKRSNMRFASVAARTTALGATPVPGLVSYVLATDSLQFTDSTSATANVWRTVLAPKNLTISDVGSSFGLRLASDGTTSLALETAKVVLGPTRIVTVDTALRLKTGAATASLTTDATALVSDVQIKAPSAALTGNLTSASITNSGAMSTASLAASGAVTAGSVASSGTITASGNLTAANTIGTTAAYGGQLFMTSNYIQNPGGGAAYMRLTSAMELGSASIWLNTGGAPARYFSTTGPIVAAVIAYPTDPGVGSYPEGTIWAQV